MRYLILVLVLVVGCETGAGGRGSVKGPCVGPYQYYEDVYGTGAVVDAWGRPRPCTHK